MVQMRPLKKGNIVAVGFLYIKVRASFLGALRLLDMPILAIQ